MYFEPLVETESKTAPLFLAGGALLFIAILLLFAGGDAGKGPAPEALPTPAGGAGSGGGGGAVSLVPGAPVPVGAGGSPVPDGPAVTIIQDVRETMHRLPLDRNNPEVYDPKPRPKPR